MVAMTEQTNGPLPVPFTQMPERTVVYDLAARSQLLIIDGFMPLPVGARIELGSFGGPRQPTDAVVLGQRLWATEGPRPTLFLDVMLRPPGASSDIP
jgi:hypothetical protein